MSANDSAVRRRYRFAEWTLTAMPATPLRHHGKCRTCGARSSTR
ncbi:hypothetical protein ACFY78_33965 [Streptomyces olindensis]